MKGKEKLKSVKISESVHELLKWQSLYEKKTVTEVADNILLPALKKKESRIK